MKPLQYFSDDYLAKTRHAEPEQILHYLEQYRLLQAATTAKTKSRLISLKVPQDLLDAFRTRCDLEQVKYQTKIKQLMHDWLEQPG